MIWVGPFMTHCDQVELGYAAPHLLVVVLNNLGSFESTFTDSLSIALRSYRLLMTVAI